MKQPIVIGLGGPKRSGKSTIARHIGLVAARHGLNNVRLSFASPIYDMVDALMKNAGMTMDQITYYKEHKEATIDELSNISLRQILQTLGTEWARETLFDNFWVAIASDKIKRATSDVIIFDDVRFQNEADMLRLWNGYIVSLERFDTGSGDPHVSEAGDYRETFTMANNDEPLRVAEAIWSKIY